ncbi:hypothetical protein [Pseudomonas citronellolis]|uniref:hypothetical protein n=1 Tax=Pseudomonas citronellolis TaxID=53408 RepID=UPI0023E43EDC|nr:hypothetical protein [Pseudomonas citronellolis]MDF3935052.1 hypothetical protein [Pseudomonas citronellolis]
MDKHHCHYHQAQPATWHCAPCQRHYGDCCVPLNAEAPEYAPACPLCRNGLQYLGAANSAQPFWERLPKFFAYALQPGPLLFAALLALACLFMPRMLILQVALFSVATKYLHSVIEAASLGGNEAPGLGQAFALDSFGAFWRQLAVFAVAGVVLWLATDFDNPSVFWVAVVALVLVLPASIIRLALDKTLGAALSPLEVGQVIAAMGWRYLILCVFLFMLGQSPLYLAGLLGLGLPKVVLLPVLFGLLGYFSVVTSAMMGYAVFQYQGALGYAVAGDDAAEGFPEAEWRRRRALAEAEVRVKEGQGGAAVETLSAALRQDPADLRLNERYHQLLYGLNLREDCLTHLARYLPMASAQNPQLAANALLNARQLQADYLPAEPEACERIAQVLLQRHKVREALSLLRNLHQRFPDYPHIPRAYLLAARGFAEGLGQIEPATKLLAFIRQRYPQSPLQDEVASLERVLQKMAAAGG